MILVRNEDNMVVRYSDAIEFDGTVIKIYHIDFETEDITVNKKIVPFEEISDVDLYSIYDVNIPTTDRYYKYIDGRFEEAVMI